MVHKGEASAFTCQHSYIDLCDISQRVKFTRGISDFLDGSFWFTVLAIYRGEGKSTDTDYTFLTSAVKPRQAAQHLSDI